MEITTQSANETWIQALTHVLQKGHESSPRGMKIRETIGMSTRFNMLRPLVTVEPRKVNYEFMAAEAVWILSGSDRLDKIQPWAPKYGQFSDDGETLFGAYGPKIAAQIDYAVQCLAKDLDTRQCVINIWRENPRPTKDVPCTTTVQWIVRGGKLHCIDTMRSSDLWLGWVYDVFSFTMLSHLVTLLLADRYGIHLDLGTMVLNAGSSHLYERNWERARECVFGSVGHSPEIGLDWSDGPNTLLRKLTSIRDKKSSFFKDK